MAMISKKSTAGNKAYQLLAHGRWFSPASFTTKGGRHDIDEILLKVALNTKNQVKSKIIHCCDIVVYPYLCITHIFYYP